MEKTPLQSSMSRNSFYHINIILQNFIEDLVTPKQTENAKSNNKIACYHLVSLCLIPTPSDV